MMIKQSLAVAAIATVVAAQRPTNTSICDYYTTALFKNNTGANQYALVMAVVNRAGTGNTTSTPPVNGIAAPGTFNGEAINLAPYFTGALNSTNRGGSSGVSVNFLADGGPAALLAGKAANTTTSAQYTLFTHLYEYFGALLGCSQYGMTGYPAYTGSGSQYEVHKFMDLDVNQVGYFNQQVGLSAASFGVTTADVTAIGTSLNAVFNVRCAPNTTVVPAQGAQQQSICIAPSCPLAVNSTCSSYPSTVLVPKNVTSTSSSSASATTSKVATQTTNAGSNYAVSGLLGALALAAAL